MGYKKSIEILPTELVRQIQEYIDGTYIYIPRIAENRKKWGENSKFKELLQSRNEEIYNKYKQGVKVRKLSEEYYISPQGIYKIISKYKN